MTISKALTPPQRLQANPLMDTTLLKPSSSLYLHVKGTGKQLSLVVNQINYFFRNKYSGRGFLTFRLSCTHHTMSG